MKHLQRLGWDASVVTVEPGDEPMDEALLAEVPPSTKVIRTPWVDRIARIKRLCCIGSSPVHVAHANNSEVRRAGALRAEMGGASSRRGPVEWLTRLLITPDSRVGWTASGCHAGMRAIRQRRPEVIYSTSPYMSAHLIALRLSRRSGIPWVADFRDPWRDNPFRDLGFRSLEWWDARLERRVLERAAYVVCNTSTALDRLRRRVPFVRDKSGVITNGFDLGLVEHLEPTRIAPADHFVFTHAGQFYGPRHPTVWFAAFRRAIDLAPELRQRIHVVLLGPEYYEGRHLAALAAEAGVDERVRVLGPKSHRETLSHMLGSDALMLPGSAGPGRDLQVPNKLYEYLAMRRPIIANVPPNSPVVDVLTRAQAEAIICDPADARALGDAIVSVAQHRYARPADAWAGVAGFERACQAAQLAEVFARISPAGVFDYGRRRTLPGSVLDKSARKTDRTFPEAALG